MLSKLSDKVRQQWGKFDHRSFASIDTVELSTIWHTHQLVSTAPKTLKHATRQYRAKYDLALWVPKDLHKLVTWKSQSPEKRKRKRNKREAVKKSELVVMYACSVRGDVAVTGSATSKTATHRQSYLLHSAVRMILNAMLAWLKKSPNRD